jgi:predicted phosphoribosyltransferase
MVLAIPRGGVVIGYEVAAELNLPLDVVVPRKLGAPNEPELAIGAIAPWGGDEPIVDQAAISYLRVSYNYIIQETNAQLAEIDRRLHEYRGTTDPPDIKNRPVIIVDDGIATGYTIQAAIISLRKLDPSKIILAVPVAAPDSLNRISALVDEIHVIETPTPFLAVGYWYSQFDQTTDNEVVSLLKRRKADLNKNDII